MIRALAVLALAFVAAVPAQAADFPGVIARLKPSVVGITTVQTNRALAAQLSGTGFAVGDGRHIVTNFHVVKSDGTVPVSLIVLIPGPGAPERREAQVVGSDPLHDLAVLRIDGAPLKPVTLRDTDALVAEGTDVAITGFPIGVAFGLVPTTHRGIVAATPANVGAMPRANMLDPAIVRMARFEVYQLDMVAFPGNSGSPLYRVEDGEVIGVVNSGFVKGSKEKALTEPTSITYAMPARLIRVMLGKLGIRP